MRTYRVMTALQEQRKLESSVRRALPQALRAIAGGVPASSRAEETPGAKLRRHAREEAERHARRAEEDADESDDSSDSSDDESGSDDSDESSYDEEERARTKAKSRTRKSVKLPPPGTYARMAGISTRAEAFEMPRPDGTIERRFVPPGMTRAERTAALQGHFRDLQSQHAMALAAANVFDLDGIDSVSSLARAHAEAKRIARARTHADARFDSVDPVPVKMASLNACADAIVEARDEAKARVERMRSAAERRLRDATADMTDEQRRIFLEVLA